MPVLEENSSNINIADCRTWNALSLYIMPVESKVRDVSYDTALRTVNVEGVLKWTWSVGTVAAKSVVVVTGSCRQFKHNRVFDDLLS